MQESQRSAEYQELVNNNQDKEKKDKFEEYVNIQKGLDQLEMTDIHLNRLSAENTQQSNQNNRNTFNYNIHDSNQYNKKNIQYKTYEATEPTTTGGNNS